MNRIRILLVIGLLPRLLFSPASGLTQTAQLEKLSLENGLNLIYEHDPSSGITVVQFFIRGGQRGEPSGKAGLAYLTTRLTLEIPDQTQTQTLMDLATRLYMGCGEDYSFITLACLSENLESSIKIISGLMRKPLFSGIRIDHIKDQMERQRKVRQDDSVHTAHASLVMRLFQDTPYACDVFGTENSLRSIKKADINSFYRRFFRAGNLNVVVSSDLDRDTLHALFDTYFAPFPPGAAPQLPEFELPSPHLEPIFVSKDTEQTLVSAGFVMDIRTARDYCLAYLLDCLIGKGIQSRLWDLRFRQKLAYSVQSRLTYAAQGSLLEAYLETDNTQIQTARRELTRVLTELYSRGIEGPELEMTKNYAKAQILRHNETKEERSRTLGMFETLGLGCEFYNDILSKIEAVTLNEINRFIQSQLAPERCLSVTVGPEENSR